MHDGDGHGKPATKGQFKYAAHTRGFGGLRLDAPGMGDLEAAIEDATAPEGPSWAI